jgi:hypothetical protein
MTTIKDLRQAGNKVYINVYRYNRFSGELKPLFEFREKNLQRQIDARGGKVTVEVFTPDGVHYMGESFCSKTDVFNRRAGHNKALGRCISNIHREATQSKLSL